jgi:CheY-like chemotaxis protein
VNPAQSKNATSKPNLQPKKTLLCIDDNKSSLTTRKAFLQFFGYSVVTATSGRAGLQLLSMHQQLDAVILDYQMPKMDGATVARKVRSVNPELPIIMLSGHSPKLPRRVLRLIDAFVTKDSSPQLLLAILDRLLIQRHQESLTRKPPRPAIRPAQLRKLGPSDIPAARVCRGS